MLNVLSVSTPGKWKRKASKLLQWCMSKISNMTHITITTKKKLMLPNVFLSFFSLLFFRYLYVVIYFDMFYFLYLYICMKYYIYDGGGGATYALVPPPLSFVPIGPQETAVCRVTMETHVLETDSVLLWFVLFRGLSVRDRYVPPRTNYRTKNMDPYCKD